MADLTKYCPPLSFAQVSEGIYRSAYPNKSTWSFIKTLQLKRMICLSPSDLRPDLIEFCKEGNIELIEYEIGHNQEPFLSMLSEKVILVLNLIQDSINTPVLIFCTNGKPKTSCVVACLRRCQGWSLASTFYEFEQFCDPEGGVADLLFIEKFKAQSLKNL